MQRHRIGEDKPNQSNEITVKENAHSINFDLALPNSIAKPNGEFRISKIISDRIMSLI